MIIEYIIIYILSAIVLWFTFLKLFKLDKKSNEIKKLDYFVLADKSNPKKPVTYVGKSSVSHFNVTYLGNHLCNLQITMKDGSTLDFPNILDKTVNLFIEFLHT